MMFNQLEWRGPRFETNLKNEGNKTNKQKPPGRHLPAKLIQFLSVVFEWFG